MQDPVAKEIDKTADRSIGINEGRRGRYSLPKERTPGGAAD
jgi:hypothetical protein